MWPVGFLTVVPIVTFWVGCSLCYFGGLDSEKNIHNPKNQVTLKGTLKRMVSLHVLQFASLYPLEAMWSSCPIKVEVYGFRWVYFLGGIFVLDTLQYMSHRLYHEVPWLYRHVHKTHHEIKSPWSFGALYNSYPDAILTGALMTVVFLVFLGYTLEEYSWVLTLGTVATIIDHVDYFDHLDIFGKREHHRRHHEVNINCNYSQPFFTFWDKVLGTEYREPRTGPSPLPKEKQEEEMEQEEEEEEEEEEEVDYQTLRHEARRQYLLAHQNHIKHKQL